MNDDLTGTPGGVTRRSTDCQGDVMIEQLGEDNMDQSRRGVLPTQGGHNADAAGVLGRRVIAALIDIGVLFCLFLALALVMGEATLAQGTVSANLQGGEVYLYVGLVLSYFFAFEATLAQTIGKRLLKLRVVRLDGTRARPTAIAIRTLLRLLDWLPVFNLVGFICMLATRRHQRIGDLLAKTIVVRQQNGSHGSTG